MKERIKSIILVMLVISNFILGSKALSNKKLWSEFGYNFFSDGFFSSFVQIFSHKQPVKTSVEAPEMLIINTGYQTSRLALTSADEEFSALVSLLREYLTDAFGAASFTRVRSDDFYAALSAKSVLMRYPVSYDSALFAYLLGIPDADFSQSFSALRNIVVTADACVLVEDTQTGHFYRARTSRPQQQIDLAIDAHAEKGGDNDAIINYAFDLGFDRSFGSQRTVLSPTIPIYSNEMSLAAVVAKNTLLRADGSINENLLHGILNVFDMNPNVLRRYTDADGTVVFVENNSVLKVSPAGVLDYTGRDDGVSLSKRGHSSQQSYVSAAADFVGRVNDAAQCENAMQLATDVTADKLQGQTLELAFDYIANGRAVLMTEQNVESAVTLTAENGKITHYRQLLRSYLPAGEQVTVNDYIYALDDAISQYESQLGGIEIKNMELVYPDNGDEGEKIPEWNVEVADILLAGKEN